MFDFPKERTNDFRDVDTGIGRTWVLTGVYARFRRPDRTLVESRIFFIM